MHNLITSVEPIDDVVLIPLWWDWKYQYPKEQLFKILQDDIIFWEAFSADGVEMPVPKPTTDRDQQRNFNAELYFQTDVVDCVEKGDFDRLGRLVTEQLLRYAERIAELRA